MADKSFANSEYIFREGESAAYAYVIKSGTVEQLYWSSSSLHLLIKFLIVGESKS